MATDSFSAFSLLAHTMPEAVTTEEAFKDSEVGKKMVFKNHIKKNKMLMERYENN